MQKLFKGSLGSLLTTHFPYICFIKWRRQKKHPPTFLEKYVSYQLECVSKSKCSENIEFEGEFILHPTNSSRCQLPLSSHICLKPFSYWTLTTGFICGQPLTHTLVTVLTVVSDGRRSLNCSGRGERRAITRALASICFVLHLH